ncbi:hypothetical protein BA6E_121138 [Bacteroidales bacterium 6E]|nr:hypothetical protein BA6E_121138 [Bacteroidales bacterium 6E]
MKTLLLIIFTLTIQWAQAQEEIKVNLKEYPTSRGNQPAFEVEIPQATTNDAVSILEKKLVPGGFFSMFKKKPRFVQEKDEWIMRGVEIREIGPGLTDVYLQVAAFPGRIFTRVFFDTADGFIGSSDNMLRNSESAMKLVRDYAVDVYKHAVSLELQEEENTLRSMERDLGRLTKGQSRSDRQISSLKSDIADMKREIDEYQMRLDRRETINLEGLDAETLRQQHAETAKEIEKDIRSNEKQIRRNERKISNLERKVGKNLRNQGDQLNLIDKQKLKIKEVEDKLGNIK